jgi:hypothetical protein
MKVRAFLAISRLDLSKDSPLWGDDTGGGVKLERIFVIVSSRDGMKPADPEPWVNVYGIDPAHVNRGDPEGNEFVFQAVIRDAYLGEFLNNLVNSEDRPSPPVIRWIPRTTSAIRASLAGPKFHVPVSQDDPPTTGPKLAALFGYAVAITDSEPELPIATSVHGTAGGESATISVEGLWNAARPRLAS